MRTVQAGHFHPLFDRGLLAPFTAAALIFVAYEGFELIPNAIDEMENPRRNLKRALVIAILATTAIYVIVAMVALGQSVVGADPDMIRNTCWRWRRARRWASSASY